MIHVHVDIPGFSLGICFKAYGSVTFVCEMFPVESGVLHYGFSEIFVQSELVFCYSSLAEHEYIYVHS